MKNDHSNNLGNPYSLFYTPFHFTITNDKINIFALYALYNFLFYTKSNIQLSKL